MGMVLYHNNILSKFVLTYNERFFLNSLRLSHMLR